MDKQVYRIMQITTKSKVHYSFGCEGIEDFKFRRRKILESKDEFIDVVDSCSIRKSEIESIEYFEQEVKNDEQNS